MGIAGAKLTQVDPDWRDPMAPLQRGEQDRRGREGWANGGETWGGHPRQEVRQAKQPEDEMQA